jgi:hypothetical protein
VEVINHALRGIPEDQARYHVCWGSGVISHVKYPELIVLRLRGFAELVGRENVIASSDCGFAQSGAHTTPGAKRDVGKLQALAEGARLASRQLATVQPACSRPSTLMRMALGAPEPCLDGYTRHPRNCSNRMAFQPRPEAGGSAKGRRVDSCAIVPTGFGSPTRETCHVHLKWRNC